MGNPATWKDCLDYVTLIVWNALLSAAYPVPFPLLEEALLLPLSLVGVEIEDYRVQTALMHAGAKREVIEIDEQEIAIYTYDYVAFNVAATRNIDTPPSGRYCHSVKPYEA